MIQTYGIWANDVECPSLICLLVDAGLANRLALETNEFLKQNPYDREADLAELEAAHGKSEDEIGAVLDRLQARERAWRKRVPMSPYVREDYPFENLDEGVSADKCFLLQGTPEFADVDLKQAMRMAILLDPNPGRATGAFMMPDDYQMEKQMALFRRTLEHLTRRKYPR